MVDMREIKGSYLLEDWDGDLWERVGETGAEYECRTTEMPEGAMPFEKMRSIYGVTRVVLGPWETGTQAPLALSTDELEEMVGDVLRHAPGVDKSVLTALLSKRLYIYTLPDKTDYTSYSDEDSEVE